MPQWREIGNLNGRVVAYPYCMSTGALSVVRVRRLLADGTARRVRENAGLSRADVARELEVNESTVGRWEDRKRVPRARVAVRYAELLDQLLDLESHV